MLGRFPKRLMVISFAIAGAIAFLVYPLSRAEPKLCASQVSAASDHDSLTQVPISRILPPHFRRFSCAIFLHSSL
jgi:hypothetical protein